jgi:hypothetical protein
MALKYLDAFEEYNDVAMTHLETYITDRVSRGDPPDATRISKHYKSLIKAAGEECYDRAQALERAETPILSVFKWYQSRYEGALGPYMEFRDRVFARLDKDQDAFRACEDVVERALKDKGVEPGDLTLSDVVQAFEEAIVAIR